MPGRIPESFIEDLLNRVDIVELIEKRLSLKRAGSEFHALCPFHEEKTPSFTISPKKQFYHCFGCGAHGSALGFMMQYEGLEFIDAVEELARSAGLEVPREAGQMQRVDQSLYALLAQAAAYFQTQLKNSPSAIGYLKQRGLSGAVARDFGIGYAPDTWSGLIDHCGGEAQLPALEKAGLISRGENRVYDKFRDRIMFPIHDRRGRVIAFGGRAMTERGPKYLNSPETELFHKGRELYGLYLARQRQNRLDQLVVVEGYMDVVALAQFGLNHAVATLGTAVTADQAELGFRNADEVVFCFDGDAAGRKAAWRAVEATLPKLREGKQARFLFLPDGEDPDSLIRAEGEPAFSARLQQAQPLSEYFFSHFTAEVDMTSLDGRAKFIEQVKPYLERLPVGVLRDMMLQRAQELGQYQFNNQSVTKASPTQYQAQVKVGKTPLRFALAHLIQAPALVERLEDFEDLRGCDIPGADLLLQMVDFCRKKPNITTAQLLELWRDHPAERHIRKLALMQLLGEADQQAQEFQDAVTRLNLQWVEKQLALIGSATRDKHRYNQLQERKLYLKNRLPG